MYITIKNKVLSLFGGTERSVIVKKNIAGSFLIKGFGILTTLLLVPFTLHLLDQEKYGIWMTIFSIVSWFNMMDIGIGNGFRNKFAEAVAIKDKILSKEYVQTLYSSMAIIGMVFGIIFTIINPYLNWYKILNLNKNFNENISLIVWLVFVLFCIQLYTKNISTIFLSLQKTTLSNSLGLYANILSLFFIFILKVLNQTNLLTIALAFMIAPIIINIYFSVKYFTKKLNEYKPKIITFPKKKYLGDLMGLGMKFFFIQITTIVLFSSANIIITQLYGPAEVTPYNVAFRLFSSVQAVFTIIITPFWTAFTDANARNDLNWIRKSIKKLNLIWVLFSIGIIILWILSPIIYKYWIGKSIVISSSLSLQFAIFTIIITWSSIYSFFVAGVGKVSISLYGAIFQFVVCIPLMIFFAKVLKLETIGIILAINLNLLIPSILLFIQTNKIINQKAYGVWNK